MKTANQTKGSNWAIVINAPLENNLISVLNNYQKTLIDHKDNFEFLATIIHDNDKLEDNQPKTPHLHIVICNNQETTKKAVLNMLSNILGINENQVSVQVADYVFLAVQYLTHKNQPTKAQYDYNDIITSNTKKLNELYNKQFKRTLTTEELEQAIFETPTFPELTRKIGLDNAKKYQSVFNQIRNEKGVEEREIEYLQQINLLNERVKELVEVSKNATLMLTSLKNYIDANENNEIIKRTKLKEMNEIINELQSLQN